MKIKLKCNQENVDKVKRLFSAQKPISKKELFDLISDTEFYPVRCTEYKTQEHFDDNILVEFREE